MNDTISQPDSRALGATVTDFARQLRAEMLCAWHRYCDLPADGTSRHPVLGFVAICQRCADHDHLTLTNLQALPAFA